MKNRARLFSYTCGEIGILSPQTRRGVGSVIGAAWLFLLLLPFPPSFSLYFVSFSPSPRPNVLSEKQFHIPPNHIKKRSEVADIPGDISGPGGDGMIVGCSRIGSSDQPDRNRYRDTFLMIASIIGIIENRCIGKAVPCGKSHRLDKLGHRYQRAHITGKKSSEFDIERDVRRREIQPSIQECGCIDILYGVFLQHERIVRIPFLYDTAA